MFRSTKLTNYLLDGGNFFVKSPFLTVGGDFMETDILKPFIALISNMGFPIAMSIYLLHRMEQRLDTMIHLLTELNHH